MANNNWGIVIGINEYKHFPEAQLSYAESDAQHMWDFLCQKAGFAPDNVLLCTDPKYRTKNEDSVKTLF